MEEHWQKGKSVTQANMYMLENRISCDVTFIVGQQQQREPAHRYVLTSRSPVFFAMFCGPLHESRDVIVIPDIEPDTFASLLRYMYTDECNISEENVVPVLYAASKYELMDLLQTCSDFLEQYITTETVCAIMQQGVTVGATELIDICLKYILKMPIEVFESDDFVLLDRLALKLILQSDFLVMDEEQVCDFCLKWAEQNCQRQGVETTHENLRGALGDVLYVIRFPCMSEINLRELEGPKRLLTEEEHSLFLRDKMDGSESMSGLFNYRNRLHKDPVLFARFDEKIEENYTYENKQIDAISFQCSEDTYMRGVSIFTPCNPGLLQGTLDLLEGSNLIYSDHQRLVVSFTKSKYDFLSFEDPVPLKKNTVYTLKLQLRGKKTYCGRDGILNVIKGRLTVTFMDSNIDESGSNVISGQVHGLLLHM